MGFLLAILLLFLPNKVHAAVLIGDGDEFVDTNYGVNYTSSEDLSICGWFQLDDAAGAGVEEHIVGVNPFPASFCLIQVGVDTGSGCGSDNGLRLISYIRDDSNNLDGPMCGDTNITVDTWTHFCFVYIDAATDAFLYMNGVQVASDTSIIATGAKTCSSTDWYIGARNDANVANNIWDGPIEEVSFYRSALTATQVAQLYSARMRRMPCQIGTTLDKYLPLDDGDDGTNADGDSVFPVCGTDTDAGVGNDGAVDGGLTWSVGNNLSYP